MQTYSSDALRGDARSLHPDGLDIPAGQTDGGGTLVALLQLVWQRCARLQTSLEQVRSASDCDPACGRVG